MNHKFAPQLIILDTDLETRFLGSDLIQISESAWASRIPVIMAAAAAPLKSRRQALAAWRAQQISAQLNQDPGSPFHAFSEKASSAEVAAIRGGEVSLSQVNSKLGDAYDESITSRQVARKATKNAFWKIVRENTSDLMDKHAENRVIPRHVLFLADGTHSFWRYRREATIFARSKGLPYLLMGINPSQVKVKDWISPEEGSEVLGDEEEAARLEDEIADFEESSGKADGPGESDDESHGN